MSATKQPVVIDGETFWACAKCERVKFPGEFHKCAHAANGLYSYCKVCQNSLARGKARKKQKLFKKAMAAYRAQK